MLIQSSQKSICEESYICIQQRVGGLFIKKNEFHKEKAERWVSQQKYCVFSWILCSYILIISSIAHSFSPTGL